jgi:hypothetical protein
MNLRQTISCLLIPTATLVVSASDPTAGVQPAIAQSASTVRVRIDFRTLYCKNTTGEAGKDEPYVKLLRAVPGSAAILQGIDGGSVAAGEYVWDGDHRKILWEGNLAPGQSAVFIVNVMEDDGSPPKWHEWLSGAACAAGIVDAAGSGRGDATTVLRCAGLGATIMRALNSDDELGQFTITVKNDNGAVKKTLHTAGARSQIGGYDEPALSDSGKTIRMRLGQGKDHPQRYQASLQVRQITNITADAGGDALTWTVSGRDDAR